MLFGTEQTIQNGRLSGQREQSQTEKDFNQKRLGDHTSDHKLATETGCHRKTWQPRENRLSQFCQQRDGETERHFLQPV